MSADVSLPYYEEYILDYLKHNLNREDAQDLVMENLNLIEEGWNKKKFAIDIANEINKNNPTEKDPEPLVNVSENVQQTLNVIEANKIINDNPDKDEL